MCIGDGGRPLCAGRDRSPGPRGSPGPGMLPRGRPTARAVPPSPVPLARLALPVRHARPPMPPVALEPPVVRAPAESPVALEPPVVRAPRPVSDLRSPRISHRRPAGGARRRCGTRAPDVMRRAFRPRAGLVMDGAGRPCGGVRSSCHRSRSVSVDLDRSRLLIDAGSGPSPTVTMNDDQVGAPKTCQTMSTSATIGP